MMVRYHDEHILQNSISSIDATVDLIPALHFIDRPSHHLIAFQKLGGFCRFRRCETGLEQLIEVDILLFARVDETFVGDVGIQNVLDLG